MWPGGWHPTPMLSAEESLQARIAADAQTLQGLGLTASELGRRLGELTEAGRDSDWFSPTESHEFRIELRKRRGILTCPWAPEEFASCGKGDGGKRAGANQFFIRNTTNGQTLEGFLLSAHLVAEHEFFGGINTPFRIDPDRLAELLGHEANDAA
jgi:hypothetical protein